MAGIENYIAFVLAGILLNITPGTDTIYILTRSISQGKKAGVYSVLGIATGAIIHTLFAALGLSVILSTSVAAYNIVKYFGVIYLCYLGIKMILDKYSLTQSIKTSTNGNLLKIYIQGIFTNLFNPKVALFFISFLPQFIIAEKAQSPAPFLILGFTFITTGTIWCLFLAYGASLVSLKLRNNSKIESIMKKTSGLVFILLGIKLAFSKQ